MAYEWLVLGTYHVPTNGCSQLIELPRGGVPSNERAGHICQEDNSLAGNKYQSFVDSRAKDGSMSVNTTMDGIYRIKGQYRGAVQYIPAMLVNLEVQRQGGQRPITSVYIYLVVYIQVYGNVPRSYGRYVVCGLYFVEGQCLNKRAGS